MDDVGVFVIYAIIALIASLGLILGRINYKINKLKDEVNDIYVRKENAAEAVGVLEGLIRNLSAVAKNLNEVVKDHDRRLDILESGHPDSDIDYGEVDDDANVIAVWFEGKKYVPEDKRDEDTIAFYADGRVVAETTRPDPQPESRYGCSDCVRFRRERIDGKWHGICSVDNVIMSDDEQYICDKFRLYKSTARLLNQNYEIAYSPTKGQVDYPYVKLNYLASDAECDELLKRVERLNRIYDAGLMSLSEYGDRLKELMQNDS